MISYSDPLLRSGILLINRGHNMSQENSKAMIQNKMGTAPILPLIFKMSLPSIFSMLILALYNIVDSIYVSRIGESALSAVSLIFPLQMPVV